MECNPDMPSRMHDAHWDAGKRNVAVTQPFAPSRTNWVNGHVVPHVSSARTRAQGVADGALNISSQNDHVR